jgi:phosphoribulokinase
MELHAERLQYGQPILKPVYDHANGTLVRPEYVAPREFVILEGLLTFVSPVLRQFIDVKVYLDPPEDVRRVWKVKRDTTKRGYTEEQVLTELEKREPDSAAYIRPQRDFADIVVRFQPPPGVSASQPDARYDVHMVLRPTIEHPDLSYLVDGPRPAGDGIRLELGRDSGRPADFLTIESAVTADQATALEDCVWEHLPGLRPLTGDQFGEYLDLQQVRHSDHLALTELLLAYHLLRGFSRPDARPLAPPAATLRRTELQNDVNSNNDTNGVARAPTRGEAMADAELSR